MKKFLLIGMVAMFVVFLFVGCGMRNNTATESPRRTATMAPTRTPEKTPDRTPDMTPTPTVENIEPTNPHIKDEIEGVIESIVPDMESMLPGNTATPDRKRSDAEMRDRIRQTAWEQGYTIYDVKDADRAMTDHEKAIDLEKSLENMREWNDMSSTRFVWKGNRVNQIEGLEKVAEYETPLLSKSEEAIHNMQLANETLNGICLLPGEEFSFVFFLGEISVEKGYKEAAVFVRMADGEIKTEKGIGGGVCQVASTLHAACQELGANIVERHAHSKPVPYIAAGKDAAISRGYKDFKFVNTKEDTIVLHFFIKNKTEIVEIYKL